jgi:hypothetical protein
MVPRDHELDSKGLSAPKIFRLTSRCRSLEPQYRPTTPYYNSPSSATHIEFNMGCTSYSPTIFQNSPLLTRPAVVLPHLVTGWHVDQAIMSEEERLVIIRFGRDWDPDCMRQDEVLYRESALFPASAPVVCADFLQASPIASRTSPLSTSAISTRSLTSSRCMVSSTSLKSFILKI